MGLKNNFAFHPFLTWKVVWYWLWYLESPPRLPQGGTLLSRFPLNAFQGRGNSMKDAHPAVLWGCTFWLPAHSP